MALEEIAKIILGKFVDGAYIGVAIYLVFALILIKREINEILMRDIKGIGDMVRTIKADVDTDEERIVCLKLEVGKLKTELENIKEVCKIRHKND